MKNPMRVISTVATTSGVFLCLLAAIWSPEDYVKWVSSAFYIAIVGKYFGVSYKKEYVKGTVIDRQVKEILDFKLLPKSKK